MKQIGNILSIISFLGVCILGFLHFKGNNKNGRNKPRIIAGDSSKGVMSMTAENVAYVDIDTLEQNYTSYKKRKADFEAREKTIYNEIERGTKALQSEFADAQRRAQAGSMSQAEQEAFQQKMMQKQQDLEVRKQDLSSKLMKDQDEFNKELHENIKGFLNGYAEEKGLDFVYFFTAEGLNTILYANKDLDITGDVLEALNTGKKYSTKKSTIKPLEKSAADSLKK
jgi:outer membrane protein